MPLPENASRSETVAGGTAVAEESQSSLWIGLAALALVAGLVLFFATGDDAPPKQTVPLGSEGVDEVDEPSATNAVPRPNTPQDGTEIGISVDEAPPTEEELRDDAVAALKQALTDRRLWSTVSVEGSNRLKLVSGFCEDENMRPTISEATAALKAVGFASIRCLEKHGAQVFEQGL